MSQSALLDESRDVFLNCIIAWGETYFMNKNLKDIIEIWIFPNCFWFENFFKPSKQIISSADHLGSFSFFDHFFSNLVTKVTFFRISNQKSKITTYILRNLIAISFLPCYEENLNFKQIFKAKVTVKVSNR